MKRTWKRCIAAALCGTLLCAPASAITKDGEAETFFDAVWEIVDEYGFFAKDDPHFFQNYINTYLEHNPDQYYRVMNELLSMLDTHSMYLSAEQYSSGFASLQNYIGIGVGLVLGDEGAMIYQVMPYSAAEDAGIQVGDIILKIDGKTMTGEDVSKVAENLRGEEGTTVTILMLREGQEVTISCTRRQTNRVYVSSQTVEPGMEYIRVAAMGSEVDLTAFQKIWNGLAEKNTETVILDLRGNGGGVISVALGMADLMTPQEGVLLGGLRWRDEMGGLETTMSTQTVGPKNIKKTVVLVDEETASAAELLAGSLKDTGSATLLGTQTYGKGQGQVHIELNNGDVLVVTTLEIVLPKTQTYEGVGIAPDVVVENEYEFLEEGTIEEMDATQAIVYGETSARVRELTERLAILGFILEPKDTFDEEVSQALRNYCAELGVAPVVSATPQVIQWVNGSIAQQVNMPYVKDHQLIAAIEMCQTAMATKQ